MIQANLTVGKLFTNNISMNANQGKKEELSTISYEEVMVKLRNMRARPAQGINSGVPTNVDLMTGEVGFKWQAERGNGREYIIVEKVQENAFLYSTEAKD